ncbi:N-acetyltransferase [Roseibium sp. RKSG952]|nr:N-acetyltransferase [Roseibium sp. RKSG952]
MLPCFETERLVLRPRGLADFDACLAMDRDPAVTRYVQGPWTNPKEHTAFLRSRIEIDYGRGLGYWSIFPKETPGSFAGWVLLIPYDAVGPEVEIGWRLNRLAWGKGCATEAARRILLHAFEELGLDRVVADIHPENHASQRVAEKIGMTFHRNGLYGGVPCKCFVQTLSGFRGRQPRNTGV